MPPFLTAVAAPQEGKGTGGPPVILAGQIGRGSTTPGAAESCQILGNRGIHTTETVGNPLQRAQGRLCDTRGWQRLYLAAGLGARGGRGRLRGSKKRSRVSSAERGAGTSRGRTSRPSRSAPPSLAAAVGSGGLLRDQTPAGRMEAVRQEARWKRTGCKERGSGWEERAKSQTGGRREA